MQTVWRALWTSRLVVLFSGVAGVIQLGVAWATLQCSDLLRRGAPGVHFITLNRSPATRAILSALRVERPWRRTGDATRA